MLLLFLYCGASSPNPIGRRALAMRLFFRVPVHAMEHRGLESGMDLILRCGVRRSSANKETIKTLVPQGGPNAPAGMRGDGG